MFILGFARNITQFYKNGFKREMHFEVAEKFTRISKV
jgi:hypothetical protein